MDLRELLDGLRDFEATDDRFFWIEDERVFIDANHEDFFEQMHDSDADLLATEVRTRAEDSGWHWWSTLCCRNQRANEPGDVAALLSLARLSRAAAEAVLDGWKYGWHGHPEALIPTLIARAGQRIEEIGGTGSFTPKERHGAWYDERTWKWRGPIEHVPGKLHFPVPVRERALPACRLDPTPPSGAQRLLYVSPVGGGAAGLVEQTVARFLDAGADCLLLQYDTAPLGLPNNVRVVRDRGHKWQLAFRHLTPEAVAGYDFIFFWDDDISIDGFDPDRFAKIMHVNRLAVAQPAIVSPFGLSHRITARQPCPGPWRSRNRDEVYPLVGRLTNFVEIMAPVFSLAAWTDLYSYLNESNRSGWGYDYVPLGRKGVVDVMPVTHTRPVSSIDQASEHEIARFLENHGLFRHAHIEAGLLFEVPAPRSSSSSRTCTV